MADLELFDGERIPIEHLSTVRLEPGDILVLKLRDRIPAIAIARLYEKLSEIFPNNKSIILDDGAELGVLKRG